MKILAVDTSSQSASCAVGEDELLLGEFYTNVKLTHSQTIMPMMNDLLRQTRLTLSDIDAFAVTTGPGSFTGLRIGISAVKGIAHGTGKPCIAVPTLKALAYNMIGTDDCLVAPVLDARRNQVYTTLYKWTSGVGEQLFADDAISVPALGERLAAYQEIVYLVGDGAKLCHQQLKEALPNLRLPAPALAYTRASSVALAAYHMAQVNQMVAAQELAPSYLRLPQAEREALEKQNRPASKGE